MTTQRPHHPLSSQKQHPKYFPIVFSSKDENDDDQFQIHHDNEEQSSDSNNLYGNSVSSDGLLQVEGPAGPKQKQGGMNINVINKGDYGAQFDDLDLDAQAQRLCVGSQDFDMYSPIRSRGSGSVCDDFLGSGDSEDEDILMPKVHRRDTSNSNPMSVLSIHEGQEPSSSSRYYNIHKEETIPMNMYLQHPNNDTPRSINTQWRFLTNSELPQLNIVIMIVGTHGDVLPFIGIARSLQALGHRIRIATHECHRDVVTSRQIEFYPLAGNPKILSEFMVKTGGSLYGFTKNPKFFASNTRMVREIIQSTWKACTECDENDVHSLPFVVDAIISNPATLGHIHVAEALAVPMHIMFPQPWYYGKYILYITLSKVSILYLNRNNEIQFLSLSKSFPFDFSLVSL